MKRIVFSVLLLVCSVMLCFAQLPEGFTEYKLDNGLTVLLWEDHDVLPRLLVRVRLTNRRLLPVWRTT